METTILGCTRLLGLRVRRFRVWGSGFMVVFAGFESRRFRVKCFEYSFKNTYKEPYCSS